MSLPAPSVSVILTAHNYGRFLNQSVRSVLDQTFQDFELVIVNDGSTDDTPVVLERHADDPRVTIVTLPGVGLAGACNAGIGRSRGRYLMRLDADDFLDPHALAVMVETLERGSDVGLVYPDYHRVDEQGRFLGYVRVPRVQDGARLLDSNPLAGGALYRRTCYDAIGGYNETLRYQEDYDFWLRFTERFRAYGVGLPLLSYRQHSGSMSKNLVNRSAARRHVKREFTVDRYLFDRETIVCAIPEAWPGVPERSPELLCRNLDGSSPIERLVEAAKSADVPMRVVVVADHPEVRRMAQAAGAELVALPVLISESGDCAALTWLRGLAKAWAESGQPLPSLFLMASPFCPLRHPDRLREAVDTLAIHGCDVVISVDAEPVAPWTASAGGLTPISTAGRVWRGAGELLAVRATWLMAEEQPLHETMIGSIELLFPEWWCVKDEPTWRVCESLLPEAAAMRVPPSAYLMVEG